MATFAHTAARTALSLIVTESGTDGGDDESDNTTGYEAIERSASEALVDIFARYLRTVGRTASAAAQHAGRSESNMSDMLVGLGAIEGPAGHTPEQLREFLEHEASEIGFPCNIASFPVARVPPMPPDMSSSVTEPRPSHVPDFLPLLPEKRTYMRTVTHNVRKNDVLEAKRRYSKNRRQAQDSLLALRDSSTIPDVPPPPPLPPANGGKARASLQGTERTPASPPGLPPGFCPILEERINPGDVSTFELPIKNAPHEPIGAAAAVTGNPRQVAILGLKHLHGIDGIDDGTRAAAEDADNDE